MSSGLLLSMLNCSAVLTGMSHLKAVAVKRNRKAQLISWSFGDQRTTVFASHFAAISSLVSAASNRNDTWNKRHAQHPLVPNISDKGRIGFFFF